ncbi:MAG: ABC transporter permease subunit [Acidobacteriota bacterium]
MSGQKYSAERVLLWHSLKGVRTLVLVIGVLLALFQVVLIAVARSLENSGQFSQLGALLPPFVRALMGPALAGFLSFNGIVSLGYFEPAVLGAVVGCAITVGTRLALEVESGFLDLILARPVTRHWIVTRSILVTAVSVVVIVAFMVAGTWAGLTMLAPASVEKPSAALVASLAAGLGVLGLSWGALALMAASAANRRGAAGGATGVAALVMFLLDYVGQLWQPAQTVARLSPFHYFRPLDLVMGQTYSVSDTAVLVGITVMGFAAAYVLFLRRDITR